MSSLKIRTGCMGDETPIMIEWFDHNNIEQRTELVIQMQMQDKPRTLQILINGVAFVIPPRI